MNSWPICTIPASVSLDAAWTTDVRFCLPEWKSVPAVSGWVSPKELPGLIQWFVQQVLVALKWQDRYHAFLVLLLVELLHERVLIGVGYQHAVTAHDLIIGRLPASPDTSRNGRKWRKALLIYG